MIEQSVDFVYPDDEPKPLDSDYREVAQKFMRIMNIQLGLLLESRDKDLAVWGLIYALGIDSLCEGVSLSDKAHQLGVSVNALAKSKDVFANAANLPPNQYSYKK